MLNESSMWMGKNIKLTITMLVSNRIDTIRKCMDSIKPILEQIPSELIVVDTGSTDGTMDIVREYTDRIVKFEWCNDFSQARNAGLAEASGEWVMFLDDDEWFDDVAEIVDFFQTGEYRKYGRAVYVVRNYMDQEGEDWSDSNASRMVKRVPQTCFMGKVHEFLTPQEEPTKYLEVFVHHYGYAFRSAEEHRKHCRRNLTLLEEELAQNPEDIRVLMQLVQEYFSLGETYRVLELCRKVMNLYAKNHENAVYAGYCYNFSLRAYVRMQDWEMAYQWGCRILEEGAPTSMALLGTVREMIQVCLKNGNYAEGLNCLKKYLEVYDILKKKVNREEICLDLSKYLQERDHDYAYMEGIALGVLAKNWKIAEECFFHKNWEAEPLLLYPDTLDYVMELWATSGFREEYLHILDRVVSKPMFHEQMTKNMKKYKDKNTGGYEKLLYLFASCTDTSAYTDKYRLFYYGLEGREYALEGRESDCRKMEEVVVRLWEASSNPLLWEDEIWEVIRKEGLSVAGAVRKTGLLRWFAQVRGWVETHGEEEGKIEEIYRTVYCEEEPEEMHFQFLELKYKESIMRRELGEWGAERMAAGWLLDYFDGFYSEMWEFYSRIYRGEMFGYDKATVLPPEAAFAVYIKLAAQNRREGRREEYLRLLPKAAECYPVMKEWCKVLLQKEKEEITNVRTYDEEMEFFRLAEQLKQNVKILLENGKREEVRQVVQQLKVWVPEDEELDALMNRC